MLQIISIEDPRHLRRPLTDSNIPRRRQRLRPYQGYTTPKKRLVSNSPIPRVFTGAPYLYVVVGYIRQGQELHRFPLVENLWACKPLHGASGAS